MARSRTVPLVGLFESSVPEPRVLLRKAVSATIEPEFGQFYASAFGGGNPYVIELIANSFKVSIEHVICTTGATGGLALLYRAFGRPGDHVLVETPGFDLFHDLADDRGLAIDTFQRRGAGYSIDPGEVEAKIRPDTRLIVLSNLHNPSGMALDYEVLGKLATIAERHGTLLVVDEVYGDFAGAEARPCPAAALSPAVVSVSSLTKIFGLATLRCGWIVGAPAVMKIVRDASTRLEFGVSNLAHAVAAQILSNPAPFSDYTGAILAQARPVVEKWVAAMTA
ncbi:MAG TPA: pyridoxal phosphate-dependent aminotransferase, partial [Afipia sp.]